MRVSAPPGYEEEKEGGTAGDGEGVQISTRSRDTLQWRRAWEVATSPIKTIPMNAFMMYMSGNSVQIFSMMIIWSALTGPVRSVWGMNQAFAPFEKRISAHALLAPKAVYVLFQLALLALGIWKLAQMGLLPARVMGQTAQLGRASGGGGGGGGLRGPLEERDWIMGSHIIEP